MKRLLLFISFIFVSSVLLAQNLTIGTGQFQNTSNLYGPMSSLIADSLYNRHAYIYSSSLFADVKNTDTIRAIAFNRSTSSTNAMSFTPILRIWFNKVSIAAYDTGSINLESRMKNAKLVFQGDPSPFVTGAGGYAKIPLDSAFAWSSGLGNNFELLVEYEQLTGQSQDVLWLYDRDDRVPAFIDNQTKYVQGTLPTKDSMTTGSNLRHPNIRLFYPNPNNVGVAEVSSVCFIHTDEDNVPSAFVTNTGTNPQNGFTVTARAGMSYSSTKTIATLLPDSSIEVVFDTMQGRINEGSDELVVYTNLVADTYKDDDTVHQALEFHNPNKNPLHFSNGPFVNNPGGGFMGYDESIVRSPLEFSGNNANFNSNFRMAEDFVVPAGSGPWDGWVLDSITLYAYQTGSSKTSTFIAAYFRILDGPPEDPLSNEIYSDSLTNSLFDTYWSEIYRVFATGDTGRHVMKVIMVPLAPNLGSLSPGRYWLEVGLEGTLASGPWIVPISKDGISNTGNARHRSANYSWDRLSGGDSDFGYEYAQGFPFEIHAALNVGLERLSESWSVKGFPNPADDFFTLQFWGEESEAFKSKTGKYELLDLSGRRVLSKAFTVPQTRGGQIHVNTATLAQGQYMLKLSVGDAVKTLRFTKI